MTVWKEYYVVGTASVHMAVTARNAAEARHTVTQRVEEATRAVQVHHLYAVSKGPLKGITQREQPEAG